MRILPEICARMILPGGISTRNIALGKASTMLPSTSILSSLAIILMREGQNLRPLLRQRHGMLEMCGPAAVARHRSPAVGKNVHFRAAGANHGLNSQHQSGRKPHARAGLAEIGNRRI